MFGCQTACFNKSAIKYRYITDPEVENIRRKATLQRLTVSLLVIVKTIEIRYIDGPGVELN